MVEKKIHKPVWDKPFSIEYIKKAFKFMLIHLSRQFFIPPSLRPFILKFCGIKFKNSSTVFIGADVLFDTMNDVNVEIGSNVLITSGVKIINHYPIITEAGIKEYYKGNIIVGDNVFIGMNSLIIKPVTIGDNAIIGAGSVVSKNVEKNTIIAGNPAKAIGFVNS